MAQVSVNAQTPQKRREAMLASTLDLSAGGTGWTPLRFQYSKPLTVLMAISALLSLASAAARLHERRESPSGAFHRVPP
jgi:hypothetical protein